MLRTLSTATLATIAVALLLPLSATDLHSQATAWRPPSHSMPAMPAIQDLKGGWPGSLGPWLRGAGAGASSLQVHGDPRPGGGGQAQFVRLSQAALPVAQWTDRNGDGRADLIEIFSEGRPAAQLIDPDYDGTADVLRLYGADGKLLREERL